MTNPIQPIRDHVVCLLRGGQAYETFDDATSGLAPATYGVIPPGAERSIWQVVEHMRLCQRDILDFTTNETGTYVEMEWPDDYWPREAAPAEAQWTGTLAAFRADRAALETLVLDANRSLIEPFPWGAGQTLLREALLAADHASYHLGQIVILRRLLGV